MVHEVAVHEGLSLRRAHEDWISDAPWRRWRRSAAVEMEARDEGVAEGAAEGCCVVRRGWSVRSTTVAFGASSDLPLGSPAPPAPLAATS